jgi:hypothetical protein
VRPRKYEHDWGWAATDIVPWGGRHFVCPNCLADFILPAVHRIAVVIQRDLNRKQAGIPRRPERRKACKSRIIEWRAKYDDPTGSAEATAPRRRMRNLLTH